MIARHVAAALVAAACVSAAFDFSSGGGEIEGVLHASGEKLQRQVIEDDGAWLLVILDRDETCGKPCADMKKTMCVTAAVAADATSPATDPRGHHTALLYLRAARR